MIKYKVYENILEIMKDEKIIFSHKFKNLENRNKWLFILLTKNSKEVIDYINGGCIFEEGDLLND